jgi:hypothetical protein
MSVSVYFISDSNAHKINTTGIVFSAKKFNYFIFQALFDSNVHKPPVPYNPTGMTPDGTHLTIMHAHKNDCFYQLT